MSKDAIIDALAHLVTLLIAERNAPPEEGGWIRTQNTAYRPPKASVVPKAPQSEKHAQIGSIGAKNPDDGRGKNHPGTNRCSRCGREGRNKVTCEAEFRSQKWYDMADEETRKGWVQVKNPNPKAGTSSLYPEMLWTNRKHRKPKIRASPQRSW